MHRVSVARAAKLQAVNNMPPIPAVLTWSEGEGVTGHTTTSPKKGTFVYQYLIRPITIFGDIDTSDAMRRCKELSCSTPLSLTTSAIRRRRASARESSRKAWKCRLTYRTKVQRTRPTLLETPVGFRSAPLEKPGGRRGEGVYSPCLPSMGVKKLIPRVSRRPTVLLCACVVYTIDQDVRVHICPRRETPDDSPL